MSISTAVQVARIMTRLQRKKLTILLPHGGVLGWGKRKMSIRSLGDLDPSYYRKDKFTAVNMAALWHRGELS